MHPSRPPSSLYLLRKVHPQKLQCLLLSHRPNTDGKAPIPPRGGKIPSPPKDTRGPALGPRAAGGGPGPGVQSGGRGPGPGRGLGGPSALAVALSQRSVGRGPRTARETDGGGIPVTPQSLSSAKIDPPPGNMATLAAPSASANWIRNSCWKSPRQTRQPCALKQACQSLPA